LYAVGSTGGKVVDSNPESPIANLKHHFTFSVSDID